MTGFARVRRPAGISEVVLTLKTVNHRGLDIHFHMPPVLDSFEPAARSLLKQGLARGHVQVHVALERQAGDAASALNLALLDRWMAAFREAARVLGSNSHPDPSDALRFPGMLQSESSPESSPELAPELEDILIAGFAEAIESLNGFRIREGAAIAEEMRDRARKIQAICEQMEHIRSEATDIFHQRLHEKLGDLLRGSSVDPQRLAQEVAILADRSDISEEIMRLKTHTAQVLALLEEDGEQGKRLDFLFQEMNRESNTVLSKTSGLGGFGLKLTDLGLAAKAEIDKMREQALNLE